MLASPLADALARWRSVAASRPLTAEERDSLRSQGNVLSPGVQLEAGTDFDVSSFHSNRFAGHVVLAGTAYHSVLEDTVLSEGCLVDQCPFVRRTMVGRGARVIHSAVDCTQTTSFGVGAVIKGGLETPGREIRIWDAMTLEDGERYLEQPALRAEVDQLAAALRFDRSVIDDGVSVLNTPWLDRVYVGPGAKVTAAQYLEDCALLSSAEEPVTVGAAVQIRRAILQWNAEVDTSAQIMDSILLEASGANRQALVTESLIGPNTVVGGGEVTASYLGPFVGFHHQSLLIAAWWPEGRGNVGYGANIGSNHTSRSPDQELWAGEGTFFGLATAVKYPSNFRDAPYSILASGVVTLPQKMALPFSLILDEPLDTETTRGLNRVIPGWVLKENVYLLLRNEGKYLQRDRARRHRFDLRIFRPEVVEKLWKARVLLANIEGKLVYTKADFPAVGKNYMLEEDRREAMRVYREFLRYAALKLFAEQELDGVPCDPEWLAGLFRRLNLDYFSTEQNLAAYLAEERTLWTASLRAKEKDDERGALIIPDYERFHLPAEEDGFLKKKQGELEQLAEKIRRKGLSPA